ncbi:GIY-YIG nuclease family protein [Mycolicibacterium neoaurum]|uniref:GIY-YIG nuclease family protein n=1 Tax=Mycolicibacterium neoaurum TaxID=1795 RepID=UPI00248B44D7|nr:GIY-YIG nuclease family protein [Mycolicibacterium neoaurum]WBP95691.1 GIY-YIG nuclease family protein [Mycolicibacterium neoaurum]WBS09373.1 GIY-YIG nuclease family protein [Mycolicibacterium neoaurum]
MVRLDQQTGPSQGPQIARNADLHKIDFSTASVEQRIKNAEKSPTYLMAPVKVFKDYRTYNLKPSALEHLWQRVFADVRLDLTQVDRNGRNYDPSEWFVVDRKLINQAINMTLSGEIVDYICDPHAGKLIERQGK